MRLENNYYFDNIVWESVDGTADINYSISVRNNPGMESKTGEFSFSTTTNFCCRLFCDSLLPSAPVTRSFIKTSQEYTIPAVKESPAPVALTGSSGLWHFHSFSPF